MRCASPQRHSTRLAPARARIGARDEQEVGGELERSRRAADADDPLFERLAQAFEHADRELGQLVEEQRAAVRERDLARSHARAAAADERDARRAVVRRAERRSGLQRRDRARPGRRVDARDLERGVAIERRHDRRQAAGEHRLADAGWSDEQQVMAARGRGREREARVARGRARRRGRAARRCRLVVGVGVRDRAGRATALRPSSTRAARRAIAGDAHVNVGHERGLGRVGGGNDHAAGTGCARPRRPARACPRPVAPCRRDRARRARPRRRALRAGRPSSALVSASATASSSPDPALRIDAGARFTVTRLDRERAARREQRGAHALARFPPGRVGQADHGVSGQAVRHVDLDAHDAAVDTFQHRTVD